ncbi:hypothetical protein [Endozoicomonas sp. ONNA2]|uniref:hypothetical protein n=1 Tax=Endozoicomonas sp. ONNA2 TaxID=2828741 RepID=UPI002147ECBA|nr:hypothetical protein [Endozoicomonas sp. ONNA2]
MLSNLQSSMAGHLSGNGSIHDLLLGDANIQSNTSAGVAACTMSNNATISNIRAERVDLATNGGSTGIGAGIVNGGSVANITGIHCSVDASGDRAHAGIAVGRLNSGIVTGTTVMNCTVTTSGESHAGIGAGYQDKGGVVTNTKAVNCNVKTSDIFAHAGIGAGFSEGTVNKTIAVNCHVETEKNTHMPESGRD